MEPFKFGTWQGQDWVPYSYPNIWEAQKTTGPDRLVIAPAQDHIETLIALLRLLPEPFGILYILLIPRATGETGRYQSPQPSTRAEMEDFLHRYKEFLETDGRHHLWVTSLPVSATLVYDNHNVLYAYGPLEAYQQVLRERGLSKGQVRFPSPHQHNYNPEFDTHEAKLMAHWDWVHFPLAKVDEHT